MDVDPAFPVRLGEFRIDDLLQVVFLGDLAAVLEHGPHGAVGIDIGILALVVALDSVPEGKVEHGLHHVRPAFPHIRTLLPVQDVRLGHGAVAGFDKGGFDKVLDGFDVGPVGTDQFKLVFDLAGDIPGHGPGYLVIEAASDRRLAYGVLDLGCFEGDFGAVPLDHFVDHSSSPFSVCSVFCAAGTSSYMDRTAWIADAPALSRLCSVSVAT